MKLPDLKTLAAGRFEVVHSEDYFAEYGDDATIDDPWHDIIPLRNGHVFVFGPGKIGAAAMHRTAVYRLIDMPECLTDESQITGNEVNAVFPVEHFEAVVAVMSADFGNEVPLREEFTQATTVPYKTTITTLNRHLKWVKGLLFVKPDDHDTLDRAVNIVNGCVRIVGGSPTADLHGWLDRQLLWMKGKSERQRLKEPAAAIRVKTGRRVICELIEFALSVLAADKAFCPKVEVGPMEVFKPRVISEKNQRTMKAGQEAIRQEREEAKRRRQQAEEERDRWREAKASPVRGPARAASNEHVAPGSGSALRV